MKVVKYYQFGSPDVLCIEECAKPSPTDNQVLIKIHATTVTSADCRIRRMNMPLGFGLVSRVVFGFGTPRKPILGSEFSGEIESIGRSVTKFKIGDEVFGINGFGLSCYAEYLCISEDAALTQKPSHISLRDAAALSFGGTTALHFIQRIALESGEKLLINGASGCVGSAAVQIAKIFNAEVTGVCSSHNMALVKSLGADHVIDYTQDWLMDHANSYDAIIDTVGNLSLSQCQRLLKTEGRLALIAANLPQMISALWLRASKGRNIMFGPATERQEDLAYLVNMVERKQFAPVIDNYYSLDSIKEAHSYVDSGRKKGSVVITLV